MSTSESPLQQLIQILPQQGRVAWIGVRPDRREAIQSLEETLAEPGKGLQGDRFSGRPDSKRQVTLIQAEHLTAVASMLQRPEVPPDLTRRNIAVQGINLLALHNRQFSIGEAILEGTGYCHPCSRMEEALGPGGYNAMRGHGGITAKVIRAGRIAVGDAVKVLEEE